MVKSLDTAIPVERIAGCVYLIRGQKVMLDRDLAALYGVKAIALRQQVKRNADRFPKDFMFQITNDETNSLLSQNVIPSRRSLGGALPYAFTQEGIAMLSTVLRSKQAVQVNIAIMRTFVRLREMLATNADLSRKVAQHDRQIAILFDHVGKLLAPPKSKKHPIGFIPADDEED